MFVLRDLFRCSQRDSSRIRTTWGTAPLPSPMMGTGRSSRHIEPGRTRTDYAGYNNADQMEPQKRVRQPAKNIPVWIARHYQMQSHPDGRREFDPCVMILIDELIGRGGKPIAQIPICADAGLNVRSLQVDVQFRCGFRRLRQPTENRLLFLQLSEPFSYACELKLRVDNRRVPRLIRQTDLDPAGQDGQREPPRGIEA